MKTISSALDTHIQGEVTSLCTCWRIERLDGTVFGFTDLDSDLLFDGVVYESQHSFNRSAIVADDTMAVANLEIDGILTSDKITDNDLRNGLFDFASVYVFLINWQDVTQNELKLRRGWFGETTVLPNGMFHCELRGLAQALSYNTVEIFTPDCRADFCDARCKLKITDYQHLGTVFSAGNRRQFVATNIPAVVTTGSTTVGSHRYWQLKPTTIVDTDYVGFAEVKMYDQAGAEVTGGTASATSERVMSGGFLGAFGTTYHASSARDNNTGSSWQCLLGDAAVATWQIDFGSAKDIKSLLVRVPADAYQYAPTAFQLRYSDDGTTWTNAKTCTAHWNANGQEGMWSLGTSSGEPTDYPTSLSAVPTPTVGVSTYVGGTVRFTTGPNTGKTMEIIDYNTSTKTVTLFDALAYPISKGDKFVIAQGCDKLFATCVVYGNGKNFRGEPHVPGQDEFLTYPDAQG